MTLEYHEAYRNQDSYKITHDRHELYCHTFQQKPFSRQDNDDNLSRHKNNARDYYHVEQRI